MQILIDRSLARYMRDNPAGRSWDFTVTDLEDLESYHSDELHAIVGTPVSEPFTGEQLYDIFENHHEELCRMLGYRLNSDGHIIRSARDADIGTLRALVTQWADECGYGGFDGLVERVTDSLVLSGRFVLYRGEFILYPRVARFYGRRLGYALPRPADGANRPDGYRIGADGTPAAG